MLAKESLGHKFDLPEEVLEVLPSDPFEQLDVARKITSIALSTRVSALQSESSFLITKLSDKDAIIDDLQNQINSLDSSLSDTADKLSLALRQKERSKKENASLSAAVNKLNRDVAKLENFRQTLMRSLQDDDAYPGEAQLVAATDEEEDTISILPSKTSSIQSQSTGVENSHVEDHNIDGSRPRISQTNTPHFTPPGSPHTLLSATSPKRTSRPLSPRRYSISFATRTISNDQSSLSSIPSSQHNSMGYDTGRTRVDAKEFFRQVRSRLSYEQFGAFLANVKELNSHKQTRQETLRNADEIFGTDNKDLYAVFESLITRTAH